MVKVNFTTSDFKRSVSDAGKLLLLNRYFELNPFLNEDGASLLARPGLRRFVEIGEGPIRGMGTEAGSFNGDLFAASGTELYRINSNGISTFVFRGLNGSPTGVVNFAITSNINETVPAYCYVADGANLYVYLENGFALGVLQGTAANNDNVQVGGVHYRFTNASVNAGTPAGTVSNPWLVALGTNNGEAMNNLANAINASGIAGVHYSTALVSNPVVVTSNFFPQAFRVRARQAGAAGNGISTTETGAQLTWTNGLTLTNGGGPTFTPVDLPDNVGCIDVAVINSFVVVIPAQGANINGRFYWIEPGETFIDPLNFATAESAPDGLNGVEVFGDQFWLSGESTTEVWFFTGDPNTPVRRTQGVLFNRGTWQDTALALKNGVITVDSDGSVVLISGGQPQTVSTPAISEQIRKGIQYQQSRGL